MIRTWTHKLSHAVERVIDRLVLRRRARREAAVIDPYIGYVTPEHAIVRGRVLAELRHVDAKPEQGPLANAKYMFLSFLTTELAGRRVWSGATETVSDEEGYFQLRLPPEMESGWQHVRVCAEGAAEEVMCPVLVPRGDARFMVISDIDDTVMETGAYSLVKNLWTTFTRNALTRHIFEDARDLMALLSEDERNPVYYVSSSPWNIHDFIADVFDGAGLVRGPKFLRDLGLSETSFITGGHGTHKGASIDTIMAANPGLRAILMGDSGQHDAAIYREAIEAHPGRVAAVVLRTPGPGADSADLADFEAIRATGTPLFTGKTFEGFGADLLALFDAGTEDLRP